MPVGSESIALHVPEILESILRYTWQDTLANSARVARFWSELALDVLWEELPCILPLLEIIGPLQRNESDGGWSFEELWTGDIDWDRVFRYAWRVQTLNLRSEYRDKTALNKVAEPLAFMSCASRLSGRPFILPRLRSLHWLASRNDLMSTTLQLVSPNLSELNIEASCDSGWSNSLTALKLITRQIKLRRLTIIPPEEVTGHYQEFEPTLKDILASQTELAYLNTRLSVPIVQSFTSLTLLRELVAWMPESETDCLNVCTVLAPACSRIRSLNLRLRETRQGTTLGSVRPLLTCRELETLYMWAFDVFSFSPADVRDMGNAWPMLKHLNMEQVGNLPWQSLVDFAELFPSLKILSISALKYTEDEIPTQLSNSTTIRFPRLRELELITEPIPEAKAEEMGCFLGALCPPRVKFLFSAWDAPTQYIVRPIILRHMQLVQAGRSH